MTRPAVSVALAVALGVSALVAQSSTRTIYVSVFDDEGVPVADLPASAFTVTENGRAQQVVDVGRATEPMKVALVVDDHGLGLPEVRESLASFVDGMPAGASIGLFSSARPEWTVVPFTRDRPALKEGIQHLLPTAVGVTAGGSALDDLVRHLARQFTQDVVARPIVLLVTVDLGCGQQAAVGGNPACDQPGPQLGGLGVAGSYTANWDLVLQDVRRSRLTFFAIAARHTDPRDHSPVIDNSAEVSGGHVELATSDAGIAPAIARIGDELLAQYAVTYSAVAAPKNGNRLRVAVKSPNLKARAPERVY